MHSESHTYETQNPSESLREQVLIGLEKDHPHNDKKITKDDIINLSLINACLAIHDKVSGPQDDIEHTKNAMEFEKNQIVKKLIRVSAFAGLTDAHLYPNEQYAYNGAESFADILDAVSYLSIGEQNATDEELYQDVNYEDLIIKLKAKLTTEEATDLEIATALKLANAMSKYVTWKKVAEHGILILTNGADVGEVEQLLQLIHQGGTDTLELANTETRPILDHIADRNWEVANALTFTFSGFPDLANAKLNPNVTTYTNAYRQMPIVKEYYSMHEPELTKLEGAIKTINPKSHQLQTNNFLAASLCMSTNVSMDVLENSNFFMPPDKAADIIEGL